MAQLNLPYGKRILAVNIPDSYIGQIALPSPVTPVTDIQTLVKEAVRRPIGSPHLAQLVRPDQRIAILVDDFTRKTPVAKILPVVLDLLKSIGIENKQLQIIVALGTHRPMTETELKIKVGEKVMKQYEVVNSSCDSPKDMVFLGTSSNGIPAWVNRRVAEADVRIGVGMITPHSDAGFSGGAKIILPGVCNSLTVNTFHAAGAFIDENQLGKVDSPLRKNLEEFVAERVPLNFIVNAILTLDGEIFQCVAGDPIDAHRCGIVHALRVFGVPLERRYEVVVANCFPYDLDLWQSTKGVFCGDLATADGGTLIWVTAATEGNSNYPEFPGYLGCDRGELIHEIESRPADHAALAAESIKLSKLKERINLVLVSDGLAIKDLTKIGIPHYPAVETAIADAINRLPSSRREGAVCVIPQAGVVLPYEQAP
jgi:nickel-dependent lactate racemase